MLPACDAGRSRRRICAGRSTDSSLPAEPRLETHLDKEEFPKRCLNVRVREAYPECASAKWASCVQQEREMRNCGSCGRWPQGTFGKSVRTLITFSLCMICLAYLFLLDLLVGSYVPVLLAASGTPIHHALGNDCLWRCQRIGRYRWSVVGDWGLLYHRENGRFAPMLL